MQLHHKPTSSSASTSSGSNSDMEEVGSELNLFKPFILLSALIGEMGLDFPPLATIIQRDPIDFQIEGSGKN